MKVLEQIYFSELRFNSCDFLKRSSFEIVVSKFIGLSQISTRSKVKEGFWLSPKSLIDLNF